MKKEFNITGWCNPDVHYMADISQKLSQTVAMIERGKYFIINRPRQYGKTTLLEMVDTTLNASSDWLILNISFEGIGSEVFEQEESFCTTFLELLANQLGNFKEATLTGFLLEKIGQSINLAILSKIITEFIQNTPQKIVLLIDEVDKSSNNQLFLDFLGILRAKFLKRHLVTQATFHSVILTGIHDIKTLKLKLGTEAEAKLNSPWNIATDYKVDMSLQIAEIEPMLTAYAKDSQLQIEATKVASQIFYYTNGYPFLVSNLCKIFDEEILLEKEAQTLTVADITEAAKRLIQRTNANFDSLKKNLQNHKELYDLVYDVIINAKPFPFNLHDPIIELGLIYGVFKRDNAVGQVLQIHNRIYAEIIYEFMSLKLMRSIQTNDYSFQGNYIQEGNHLNMEKVLLNFQAFIKSQYRKADRTFVETQGRLLFLAFLKPILNGAGFAFKEPQISEEKRLDIAVSFYQFKYLIELKLWRGKVAHEKGLTQLTDYLERENQPISYLIIFDHRVKKSWEKQWLNRGTKKIFAVWV
ncbi:MAG: AAA family ATPase [Saprospiraceae bacterium]